MLQQTLPPLATLLPIADYLRARDAWLHYLQACQIPPPSSPHIVLGTALPYTILQFVRAAYDDSGASPRLPKRDGLPQLIVFEEHRVSLAHRLLHIITSFGGLMPPLELPPLLPLELLEHVLAECTYLLGWQRIPVRLYNGTERYLCIYGAPWFQDMAFLQAYNRQLRTRALTSSVLRSTTGDPCYVEIPFACSIPRCGVGLPTTPSHLRVGAPDSDSAEGCPWWFTELQRYGDAYRRQTDYTARRIFAPFRVGALLGRLSRH